MKLCVKVCMAIVCVFALTGCFMRNADFTMRSSQNIDFRCGEYKVDKTRRVKGKDKVFIFAMIPFGLPDVDTATIDAGKGIAGYVGLSNVVLSERLFWLVLGYSQIEVRGYPIVKKGEEK